MSLERKDLFAVDVQLTDILELADNISLESNNYY